MNGQQIAPCYIDLLAILCLLFLLDLYYLNNDLKKSCQISEEETTHKDSLFSQIQS